MPCRRRSSEHTPGLPWAKGFDRGSRMPLRRRSSPHGANGREDWLAADADGRQRPWAYEELLFGTREERARARELAAVVDELEAERRALEGLHETLDARLARITALGFEL